MTPTDSSQISVVIPCYNNRDFVAEAIESALDQTYANVEVIVVNDGSTDGSDEVIDRYADRVSVIHQENAGACAARNAGLDAATGDFVKLLDADDVLMPDVLERQKKFTDGTVIVVSDYALIDTQGQPTVAPTLTPMDSLKAGHSFSLATFFDYSILTSTVLIPLNLAREAGGFDPNVLRGQEHEFFVRLYLNGHDFIYQPLTSYKYRQYESSTRISSNNRRMSYIFDIENFRAIAEKARTGLRHGEYDGTNRTALALAAWRIGRRLVRYSEPARAKAFFSEARRLGGNEAVYGTRNYKAIVGLVGPLLAERISSLRNRLSGRAVEGDL